MSKVLFVLGAGPRIGWSVATKFKAEGYKVAVGSRNPKIQKAKDDGFLPVTVDVTKSEEIESAFATVKKELGVPNVVVYNTAALTFPKDAHDPLEIEPKYFERDTAINLFGVYTSLRESVRGFKTLANDNLPTVFIATGNVLPWQPSGLGLTLGAGKAGVVNLIESVLKAYSATNYRLYFASQVTKDGGPVPYPDVDGEEHGKVYYDLVQSGSKADWDVRFLGSKAKV